MPRSFNFSRDPQNLARVVLGALVAANLVAAGLVLFPPGGSAEDLDRQLATLNAQLAAQKATVERLRLHSSAVDKGRSEGDQFLADYFLPLRTSYSTLLAELQKAAEATKIRQRDTSFSQEPIEGSDTLKMISITASYEGKYEDLMRFVHEIDQSGNLLIIDTLSAAQQQSGDLLTVNLKLDTFVRDESAAGGPGGQ